MVARFPEPVTRSPRCYHQGLRRTSRLSAGFFVSCVHSTAPRIEDPALDPENIEKSALGSFRGPIIQFQPVVYLCLGTKRGSAEERPSDERNEPVPLKLTRSRYSEGGRERLSERPRVSHGPLEGTPTSNLDMGRRPEWALPLQTRSACRPEGPATPVTIIMGVFLIIF